MEPHRQLNGGGHTPGRAVGLWFRLVYYAVLCVVGGLLMGVLYMASSRD
ncbi:MAG: hypothetical protein IH602_17955 [Bryobacteraceae bacterium]|nr:hypothetical protein [Bryobacteraceae bacterium]